MKLSKKDVKRLENLLEELARKLQENGYDDTPESIFECDVIDKLQSSIDEFV